MKDEGLKIITDPAKVDSIKWNNFVSNHPQGNIFQSHYIYHVFKGTVNYDPIAVFLLSNNDEILALVVSAVQIFAKGFLKTLSSRAVIWGGPLVKNNDKGHFKKIINFYNELVKKKAIFTEVRLFDEANIYRDEFQDAGYKLEERLNIIIDLKKSHEDLWNEMSPTRKKQIRRAERRGTIVREIDYSDNEEISHCYSIIEDVYNRAKLPLPDNTMFLNAIKNDTEGKYLKIFVAENQKKVIGVRYVLLFNKTIYDWYAGSDKDFNDKYPNDILPWEIFKWGVDHKFEKFDFGGAGKPGIPYGVRDYKKKFGGKFINVYRYKKFHHPIKMRIASSAFRVWQRLKRKN